MSIFKDSFEPGVRGQLTARQNAINGTTRTPATIQYFNARNAWIRMTSAVEVGGDRGALARNYVLLGGTATLKSGIGTGTGNAYSTVTPGGGRNRLGIRPMPGITSIDVKSKAAFGSLREITVNFQCWDIRQLEDLELLYMRPGYSVLVEWGWMPYLTNGGALSNIWRRNDRVLNGTGPKEDIWQALFTEASSDGNYDAMYGFVKNYSWSARVDGGYDCTTTIITMGEIIESLKINYGAYSTREKLQLNGLFNTFVPPPPPPSPLLVFLQTLALFSPSGIGAIIRLIVGDRVNIFDGYSRNIIAGMCTELYAITLNNTTQPIEPYSFNFTGPTGITGVCDLLKWELDVENSDKDTISDGENQVYIRLESFIQMLNAYVIISDGSRPLSGLSTNEGNGVPLLCLGEDHQISTNPTVCLINNPLWDDPDTNFNVTGLTKETLPSVGEYNKFTFPYYNDRTKFGTIGNIYVNLDYIFKLANNDTLANEDKKEKNDIILFDFLKSMMNGINATIGNVANFDIFVDPVDSIGRIIDVNYVDTMGRNQAFTNAFEIQVHNLSSVVRNYKLESQIFPDQVTTIAIGAQVQGGALGTNTNTLVDFNQNLTDRIVGNRGAPLDFNAGGVPLTPQQKLDNVQKNFGNLASYFVNLQPGYWIENGNYDVEQSSKYANSLKDIIAYFRSFIESNSNNRDIIPTKLSLEMDGIGGIRIGNLFRIPNDILPRGYRGGGAGPSQIAYVVTGLGHSVQNNDWVTKIDAQFVLLDPPTQPFTRTALPKTIVVTPTI